MTKEVHNVVVWFNNGESRVFGATDYYEDATGIALYTEYGVVSIDANQVSIIRNPMFKWPDEWSTKE
jgi:hypothetical protein